MTFIDYFIFIIYVLGIFAVGFFLTSKNNSAEDMFATGGESPWSTSGLSSFMTMFSAGTFVVWGGRAYEHAFDGVVTDGSRWVGAKDHAGKIWFELKLLPKMYVKALALYSGFAERSHVKAAPTKVLFLN